MLLLGLLLCATGAHAGLGKKKTLVPGAHPELKRRLRTSKTLTVADFAAAAAVPYPLKRAAPPPKRWVKRSLKDAKGWKEPQPTRAGRILIGGLDSSTTDEECAYYAREGPEFCYDGDFDGDDPSVLGGPALPGACGMCGFFAFDEGETAGYLDCATCADEDEHELIVLYDDCTGICVDAATVEYYRELGFGTLDESDCIVHAKCYEEGAPALVAKTGGQNNQYLGDDDDDNDDDGPPDWVPACAQSCESCEDFAGSNCGSSCSDEEAANMTEECAADMNDKDDDDADLDLSQECDSHIQSWTDCMITNRLSTNDDDDDEDVDLSFYSCEAGRAGAPFADMCADGAKYGVCEADFHGWVECSFDAIGEAFLGQSCAFSCEPEWAVEGELTVEGLTVDQAAENEAVFVSAIAATAGVNDAAVTVAFAASGGRRRLADGVVVSYTIAARAETLADAVVAAVAATSPAEFTVALEAAAVEEGVADDFADVTTTALPEPEANTATVDAAFAAGTSLLALAAASLLPFL